MTQHTLENTLSVRVAREHNLKNADITQRRDFQGFSSRLAGRKCRLF